MLILKDDATSVAYRRIIKSERVDNEDKILSIYEKEMDIIKRYKYGAKAEFEKPLRKCQGTAPKKKSFVLSFLNCVYPLKSATSNSSALICGKTFLLFIQPVLG